jgi:Uma2 family endonuclease
MIVELNVPQIGFNDEELYKLCMANPDLPIERDEKGRIIIMPPTGFETSYYNSDLVTEINIWNRKARNGKVTDSNGGYTLPDTSMRAPDVAWISNERIAQTTPEDQKRFIHACPDFVIELASESDSLWELQEKMEKYIKNGVRLAWLIDKKNKQVHIYRPLQTPVIQSFNLNLSGENVLEGFNLDLTQIF